MVLPGVARNLKILLSSLGGFATDMIWATFVKPFSHDLVESVPATVVGVGLISL
jgi:hypothetical protein